nr:MAG TPA: hypothetical protein [Caudoviricetes sp.]
MDDKTKDKLFEAIVKFLNDLIHIADEENLDRDSFVNESADLFRTMATISTFRNFKTNDASMYEEKIVWHEITERALTEEEKSEYAERGYADYEIPEYMFSGEMPKDRQEILVVTSWGVSQDVCVFDYDAFNNNLYELETRGDWDGVKAWADMPKYKGGDIDA